MIKLFLIIFVIHFSVAMWILSIGEMTAYILFNIWEIPIFYWIETLHPSSGPMYSIQDFIVAGLGATFWGLFFVGFRWIVKKVSALIERNVNKNNRN